MDRAGWQHQIDQAFPRGALCTWEHLRGEDPVIYRVPWIQVLDMAGMEPVVSMSVIEKSRVLGPERLVTYAPVKESRWPPGTVRVTFGTAPGAMYWNPRVPPALHGPMARERERLISQAGADNQDPGVLDEDGPDSGVPAAPQGPGT